MCQASAPMRAAIRQIEKVYPSAVLAGIVADKRHLKRGGYHCCLVHLLAYGNGHDYSARRPFDSLKAVTKAGRVFSCALDIGLGRADMKRLHANVRRVYLDRSDPRRRFINAINCWDGSGDAVRYDFQAGTAGWATPDHRTHAHCDVPRAYVDIYRDEKEAAKASRALVSVVTGETRAAWTAREEPKPKPKPKPPVPAPRPPATPTPRPPTHRVKAGDTLWAIAKRYDLSVTHLKTWNALTSDTIAVGRVLRLAAPPKPTRHTVVRGDTLWEIAQRYKVTVGQIKSWNGLTGDTIMPGKVLRIA